METMIQNQLNYKHHNVLFAHAKKHGTIMDAIHHINLRDYYERQIREEKACESAQKAVAKLIR